MPIPELEPHCGSWIAKRRDDTHPIEVFDRAAAETAYDCGFVVFTAAQWLARLNQKPAPVLPIVGFYCTMIREPGPNQRVAWLAGPFDTKAAAEARVPDARREAEVFDPRAVWDSFGVTRMERSLVALPFGVLNEKLGLPVD